MQQAEFHLRLLLNVMRRRRLLVWLLMLAGAVAAGSWQIFTGKKYEATVVVSLAADTRGAAGGLSSIIGQLGPIASLVGAQGIGGAQRPEPLAVLQSQFLTKKYIADNDLLKTLFWRRWNANANAWKTYGFLRAPTLWDGSEYFKKIRRVSQDTKTGLITITITWRDPQSAARWANDSIAITNEYLREKEMNEAQRNVNYLTDLTAKSGLVEVRGALSALIQQEVQRVMIVNGTEEFAFRVLDPATAPERPVPPGVFLSALFGGVGGFLMAIFWLTAVITLERETTGSGEQ